MIFILCSKDPTIFMNTFGSNENEKMQKAYDLG
jgi:hypothetical protein